MAALALCLARAPRQDRLPSIALALVAGGLASLYAAPAGWTEAIFLCGWISVALTAALIHWPGGVGGRLSWSLGLNAGFWSGLLVGRAGSPSDLVIAAAGLLLIFPGAWLVNRRWTIALKVGASWLIAIAVLAAVLPLVPTPGYVADHMN